MYHGASIAQSNSPCDFLLPAPKGAGGPFPRKSEELRKCLSWLKRLLAPSLVGNATLLVFQCDSQRGHRVYSYNPSHQHRASSGCCIVHASFYCSAFSYVAGRNRCSHLTGNSIIDVLSACLVPKIFQLLSGTSLAIALS